MALKYNRAAIVQPPKTAGYAMPLMGLRNSCQAEYDSYRKSESMSEAIACFRDALFLLLDHEDRNLILQNLESALRDLSRTDAQDSRLEEAIELFREAAIFRPLGHTNRP